jgi:hypothetical protein
MSERQALALLLTGRRFSLARGRPLATLMRMSLTAAALMSASPLALASGTPSTGAEPHREAGPAAQPPLTKEEIQRVLPLLSKYSETRQLATALESSIRQGDLSKARDLMERLMEASTFAALTSDWLNDPDIRRILQNEGVPGADPASPAGSAEVDELRKALDEERQRAQSLAREQAAAAEELATLKSDQERAVVEVTELRQALERERERGQTAVREHAAATEELTSLKAQERAAAAAVTELQETLGRERERGQSLEKEVADLTTKLQARQEEGAAATAEASELRKALGEEQERSRTVAREHAALSDRLASIQSTQSIAGQAPAGSNAAPNSAAPPDPAQAQSQGTRVDLKIGSAAPNPLVTRAEALLRTGDVSGARLLLERASQAGDTGAMMLLGETYDPRVLASLGAIGVRGDILKAEELYARARALRAERTSKLPAEAAK